MACDTLCGVDATIHAVPADIVVDALVDVNANVSVTVMAALSLFAMPVPWEEWMPFCGAPFSTTALDCGRDLQVWIPSYHVC